MEVSTDALGKGTFPQESLPCPGLAFAQHNCRIRCVDASSMSLPCRALPMGKILLLPFWLWVSLWPGFPIFISHRQGSVLLQHPSLAGSPIYPLPTLLGELNVP